MDEENNQTTESQPVSSSASDEKSSSKKAIIFVVVAVVIAALFALFIFMSQSQKPQVTDEALTETEEVQEALQPQDSVTTGNIIGNDQVYVVSATLTNPGFVSVHEQEDELPGDVIGASTYLLPGTYSDLYITLTRDLIDGETIYIVLLADDGDGILGFPLPDQPVLNEMGSVVGDIIVVSLDEEAEEKVEEEEEIIEEETEEVVE